MSLKRRSYEAGHKPKFLVIIDESPECDRAVYYASRRAARTGASVVMLLVIEPHDRHQQWLGVADIMRAEAHEAADRCSTQFAARANGVAGITPERVIRDGEKSEEILKLIDEDEDIAILVLAAGTGKEGPGPLVASSARPRAAIRSRSRSFPGTSATRTSTRCRSAVSCWLHRRPSGQRPREKPLPAFPRSWLRHLALRASRCALAGIRPRNSPH